MQKKKQNIFEFFPELPLVADWQAFSSRFWKFFELVYGFFGGALVSCVSAGCEVFWGGWGP